MTRTALTRQAEAQFTDRQLSSPEPCAVSRRRSSMWSFAATALATGLLVLAGCSSDDAAGPGTSGVTGQVTLGPSCPVESAGSPCENQPPANVVVTVFEALSGEAHATGRMVARATTDSHGSFRTEVPPGDYIVTARAGMSCELVDAGVLADSVVTVTVACDTGIR